MRSTLADEGGKKSDQGCGHRNDHKKADPGWDFAEGPIFVPLPSDPLDTDQNTCPDGPNDPCHGVRIFPPPYCMSVGAFAPEQKHPCHRRCTYSGVQKEL